MARPPLTGSEPGAAAYPATVTPSSRAALAVVLVIVLCAATLALFGTESRFKTIAPLDLDNLDFAMGSAGWFGTGATLIDERPRAVLLTPAEGVRVPFVARFLPEFGAEYVKVSAEVAVAEVAAGAEAWQRAFVLLWNLGPSGERWRHWPHQVASLEGDSPWRRYEAVIPTNEAAARRLLVAYMGAPSGRMLVRGLAIETMEERTVFRLMRLGLGAAWLAAGLWVVHLLLQRRWRSARRLLAVGMGLAVVFAGLAPQPDMSRAAGDIRAAAAALWVDSRDLWSGPRTPPPSEVGEAGPGESGPAQDAEPGPSTVATPAPPILLNAPSDKLTHFLGFAILAAVALLGFGSRGVVPVLGALVLLAVVTEILQSFPITREAQWTDLASDGVGILTGAATYLGVRWSLARLRGRRRGVMNVPRPGSP